MIQDLSIIQETEQDLHIAKHIAPESLPAMIQPIMSLAQSDAERDILLLSLLTACGSVMPNLYFRYGIAAKRYYANLQCFIVGSAACGKGIANLALELVRPIHEATPLLIPGDATYPAFYQQLAKQHGRGLSYGRTDWQQTDTPYGAGFPTYPWLRETDDSIGQTAGPETDTSLASTGRI